MVCYPTGYTDYIYIFDGSEIGVGFGKLAGILVARSDISDPITRRHRRVLRAEKRKISSELGNALGFSF